MSGSRLSASPVPASWQTQGITRVASHPLPAGAGLLTLAWAHAADDPAVLALAITALDAHLARAHAEASLADLTTRVDNAQLLAEMGDYDWHIPSDTNTWSDQLFRIYGYEPGSFHPSYEKFLSLIHPDDRDRITAVHQNAYATGEPYQMIERIVRPDGEVRYLSSNGQVIMDSDGTPVRMRGTCVDITERVLADRERERIAARFQGLVDSSPDAILVLGDDLRVLEANQGARQLLGGEPRGHRIHEILPGWPDNGTSAVRASGLRGNDLSLDVTTVAVKPADDAAPANHTLVALFLRDARARLDREAMAARLAESQLRRRQALEINDSVVQGLVAAVYALEQGSVSTSSSYLDHTLAAARAMMDDLLAPLDGQGLQPGDLVRTAPAAIGERPGVPDPRQEQSMQEQRKHRVLVVDDAEELRMLLRMPDGGAEWPDRRGGGGRRGRRRGAGLRAAARPGHARRGDAEDGRARGAAAHPRRGPGRPGGRAVRVQPEHAGRQGPRGRRRPVRRQGRVDARAAGHGRAAPRTGLLTGLLIVAAEPSLVRSGP